MTVTRYVAAMVGQFVASYCTLYSYHSSSCMGVLLLWSVHDSYTLCGCYGGSVCGQLLYFIQLMGHEF